MLWHALVNLWLSRHIVPVDPERGEPEETEADGPEPSPPSGYVDMLGQVDLDDAFWASFIDLTGPAGKVVERGKPRRRRTRKLSALTRIVWHQTSFAWRTYLALKAARKYSGHHKINAHVCIDRDGSILLLHGFLFYLATANAYNSSCLSIEIMGNFEGELGQGNWYKPEKFGAHRPERIQLIRARQLTLWLMDPEQGPADAELPPMLREWRTSVRKHGNPLKWVNPHKMATDDRPLDCGSESWYHVGEWSAACVPGLGIGPSAGRGEPLPDEWRSPPPTPPLPA